MDGVRIKLQIKINSHSNTPSEKPNPPDRKNFEQRIWQLNNRLSKIQDQISNYWTEEKRVQFETSKKMMENERRFFGQFAEDELHLSQGLRDLEGNLQRKQMEMHNFEEENGDLVYKSMAVAKEKLGQLEEQFKERKFTNIRDEQLWVAQMDRLQRNISRLTKYAPLVDQKRILEEELKEQRGRIRETRQKMRTHRENAENTRRQLLEMQRPFRQLKRTFAELREEKHALVQRYYAQRDEYRKWLEREDVKRPHGTFPAAALVHDQADFPDLFNSQKQMCHRLIRYLEGLKQFGENRVHGVNREKGTVQSEGEDSAEELPESFQNYFGLSESRQKRRENLCDDVRKLAKKQAMPLSHGIDWIRMFGEIDVSPPRTHADVPSALREVQRALNFYEAQTRDQEEAANDGEHWLSGLTSPLGAPSLISPGSIGSRSSGSFSLNSPLARELEDEPGCSSSADSSSFQGHGSEFQ